MKLTTKGGNKDRPPHCCSKNGLKDAIGRRQKPELQRRLLDNTEDIAAVPKMLSEFTPQELYVPSGSWKCLKTLGGHSEA